MITTLYKINNTGKLGTWSIRRADEKTIIMTSQTGPDDAIREYREIVPTGKAGRTLDEQVESRIQSRIKNKLDGGYKLSEADARAARATNSLALPLPMLAVSKPPEQLWAATYAQPKLNGMRLLVTSQGGRVFGYTRKSQELPAVQHIYDQLRPVFKDNPDLILDGELYVHGASLQEIMSWAKREQDATYDLEYHVFDMISKQPFMHRAAGVDYAVSLADSEHIIQVPSAKIVTHDDVQHHLGVCLAEGFEGVILRNGQAAYSAGKRSKDIVKVKQFFDEEYLCTGTEVTDAGVTVLHCTTAAGKLFKVTAPGNHTERLKAARLVGKWVTIKHAGLTPYGIPFHPVCLGEASNV